VSLFRRRNADLGAFADPRFPPPNRALGLLGDGARDRALRVSAVWACLRLRADLISTLPVDVYRRVEGRAVEVPRPPVLTHPSSMHPLLNEWLYATQMDLDRYGNAFGRIVARDGAGRPMQIEPYPAAEWSVRHDRATGAVTYRHLGQAVDSADVWHERQYSVPGVPVGLSPVAAAAMTLAHNLSAQEFALTWFTAGAQPTGMLKNTSRTVSAADAAVVKERFAAATAERGVFVAGADWDYQPGAAAASDARFLDAMGTTSGDVCRYLGVPGDMVDVASDSASAVTYANVTQRNLQLLTLNLGPAITRRELTFSDRLVAAPRFVKFNADAMLRMDARAKAELLGLGVDKRLRTPDEARALLDLPPLAEADYAQFDRLFGATKQPPGSKTTGAPA
jgi:HK97 family phage portal protein